MKTDSELTVDYTRRAGTCAAYFAVLVLLSTKRMTGPQIGRRLFVGSKSATAARAMRLLLAMRGAGYATANIGKRPGAALWKVTPLGQEWARELMAEDE